MSPLLKIVVSPVRVRVSPLTWGGWVAQLSGTLDPDAIELAVVAAAHITTRRHDEALTCGPRGAPARAKPTA
jgi:hypothetical protein